MGKQRQDASALAFHASRRQLALGGHGEDRVGELLDRVELPVKQAELLLSSGRRVELRAATDEDRITVRAPDGRAVVRISVTDAGAVVDLSSSELELRTPGTLKLTAEQVSVRAERDLELHAAERLSIGAKRLELHGEEMVSLQADGDLQERVRGDHHLQVDGAERVEAASVELQANEQSVRVRALEGIRLDGEHIGLNDDPCPQPFGWSALSRAQGDEEPVPSTSPGDPPSTAPSPGQDSGRVGGRRGR